MIVVSEPANTIAHNDGLSCLSVSGRVVDGANQPTILRGRVVSETMSLR